MSDKILFQSGAIIPDNGVKSMARGWRIFIDTQELTEVQAMNLMKLKGKYGIVLFAPEKSNVTVEDIDLPDFSPEFKTDKSPGQRMRAVIYRIWERTDRKINFEIFYKTKMDSLCEWLKSKYLD